MAHKTLIDGTAYDTKGGNCLVDGTGFGVKKGRTLVEGTGFDIVFSQPCVVTIKPGSDISYGNATVTINGTTYKSSADLEVEVESGTVITCAAKAVVRMLCPQPATCYIKVNGSTVASATATKGTVNSVSYSYEVLGDVSITLTDDMSTYGGTTENHSRYWGIVAITES